MFALRCTEPHGGYGLHFLCVSVYGVGVNRRTKSRGGGNEKKRYMKRGKGLKTCKEREGGGRKGGEGNTGETQKGKVERAKDVDTEQGRGKGRRPQGKKAASQGQKSDAGGGEGSL